MSYNITAWNSDDAHLSRFSVNTASGVLLFVHALSLLPLVLWQKSYFPLRAHGLFFVLARLCGVMLIGAYFASFMPLNRMWISLYLCFIPLAYLFPTLQRCWNIFFILQQTSLKLRIKELQHKSLSKNWFKDVDDSLWNSLSWCKRLVSGKFYIAIAILLVIVHAVLYIPVPFLFFYVSSLAALIYGLVIAGVTGFVYVIGIVILFIMICRMHVRENFHIFKGIVVDLALSAMIGVFLIIYIIITTLSGSVKSYETGRILYFVCIPFDELVQLGVLVNMTFSVTVPLIHSFFWHKSNHLMTEQDRDEELGDVLNDDAMKHLFKEHAACEWSLENIMFYEQAVILRTAPLETLLPRTTELYREFISESGHLALNINNTLRDAVYVALHNQEEMHLKHALEDVIIATKTNMHDTFGRFKKRNAKIYDDWARNRKVLKKSEQALGWTDQNAPSPYVPPLATMEDHVELNSSSNNNHNNTSTTTTTATFDMSPRECSPRELSPRTTNDEHTDTSAHQQLVKQ